MKNGTLFIFLLCSFLGLCQGCPPPGAMQISNVTAYSATFSWTPGADPSIQGHYLALVPAGSSQPVNPNSILSYQNTFTSSGLDPETCYDVYLRSLCTGSVNGTYTFMGTFCTLAIPPGCGGFFVDNGGASGNYLPDTDQITTICPDNFNHVVSVVFTEFAVEANADGLYVYNGNSVFSPQVSSGNPAGSGPLSQPGAFWGNTIPGPFTSTSPDGCLT